MIINRMIKFNAYSSVRNKTNYEINKDDGVIRHVG